MDPEIARAFEQALAGVKARPADGQAWGDYGLLLHYYGHPAPAEDALAQAVLLAPSNPRWPFYLGRLILDAREREGLALLEQSVRLADASFRDPSLFLAEALTERGRRAEAIPYLLDVPRDHPAYGPAQLHLARLALLDGRLEEMPRHLETCLTNQFTARQAYTLLASFQQRTGNGQAAATASRLAGQLPSDMPWPDPLKRAIAAQATGRMALIDRFQTLLFEGQRDQLMPLALQLAATYPSAPEGWLYLGRLRLVEREFDLADEALRRHLELEPDSVDGHMQMGLLHLHRNRPELAVESFERVLRQKQDSEGALYNLGVALMRLRRWPNALDALNKAITAQPSFVEGYLSKAQVQSQLGAREDALETLRLAMRINPFDIRAQDMLERLETKPPPNR